MKKLILLFFFIPFFINVFYTLDQSENYLIIFNFYSSSPLSLPITTKTSSPYFLQFTVLKAKSSGWKIGNNSKYPSKIGFFVQVESTYYSYGPTLHVPTLFSCVTDKNTKLNFVQFEIWDQKMNVLRLIGDPFIEVSTQSPTVFYVEYELMNYEELKKTSLVSLRFENPDTEESTELSTLTKLYFFKKDWIN